jgi:hypothetical protein
VISNQRNIGGKIRPTVIFGCILTLLFCAGTLSAGQNSGVPSAAPTDTVVTSPAEPVIPFELAEDLRSLPYFALRSSATKIKPYRPLLRPPFFPKYPAVVHKPAFPQAYLPSAPMPSAVQNFAGLSLTDLCFGGQCGGGWPPDTNGDVGPNHYILAVNVAYAIYSKTGTLLASFTEDNLWGTSGSNPCNGNSQGDPIVVYDPLGDRWILTHFAFGFDVQGNPISPFYECIAVSKTSDPVAGGWWLYPLRMDPGGAGPPAGDLNDYPKFGIWPDCLYMAANEFDNSGFVGVLFAAFSRSDLEAGRTLSWTVGFLSYPPYAIFTMIPSTMLGASPGSLPPAGTPNYFVSESQTFFGFEVREFTTSNDCSVGSFNATPVVVAQDIYDYNFGSVVPQPGPPTTPKLDSLGDRLMQKVPYRKIGSTESLWVVHSVRTSVTSTVRPQWAQIDVSGGTISPTAVQQEIYAPDTTLYRWMGSLSVDKDGNMALGYSTSNDSLPNYPSIAYSGRLASDPLGTLQQSETQLWPGLGSQTNNCGGAPCDRWGDYSSMSVDPSDDCTFWYTNEYYSSGSNGSSGNWQTRIGSFSFCDPNGLVKKVSNGVLYPSIGTAYNATTGIDALDVQDITFYENLTLDKNYQVTINGGYDSSFLPFSGFSAVHGSLTIAGTYTGTGGQIIINGLSLQ